MPDDERKDLLSRRCLFKTTAAMVAGAGIASVIGSENALAAKVSKQEAHYQNHPHGKQHCFVCKHYFVGYCQIVQGPVSAHGWCKFFAPSAAAASSGAY
jgi:hypothetical protein